MNFFLQSFIALASLGYEKSCVLSNCAALASQIAAEQNLDNDEGLKIAAKHYQVRRTVVTTSLSILSWIELKIILRLGFINVSLRTDASLKNNVLFNELIHFFEVLR